MIIKPLDLALGRREFILGLLPVGPMLCLGCGNLLALATGHEGQKTVAKKHKFLEDAGMSFQEAFDFAYKSFARLMKDLGDETGQNNLVEMIKSVIDEGIKNQAQTEPKESLVNDFATFRAGWRKKPDRFWDHVETHTIVEDSDNAIEFKVSECLFAKTLRDADAADIGYACFCRGDFAMARAYNSKLSLIRTKTLMQGDDCYNPRWTWEG